MDPVKILKRAWHILWSYRALWVFGLILAVTAAGSSGGSSNNGTRIMADSSDRQYETYLPNNLREGFNEAGEAFEKLFEEGLTGAGISQGEITALIWIGVVFVLIMLAVGIVMAVARYVSETAVIRMVDEYETTDAKMTVRQGFRIGWSRTSWRLFLINLIVNLPAFLLLAILVIVGFMVYTMIAGRSEPASVAGTISLIGVAFLTIFVIAIVSIVLRLLRQFFWRVCAIEEVGVRESLRRGYQMVRENWQNAGVMWLIMLGLGIAWLLVSFITIIITLPVVLITSVVGAVAAAIPGFLLVGLFSLFLSGPLPWIVGGIFVLPLFFILAFSPWILLTAWEKVFTSIVWTLTYREIKALSALEPETEIEPVED
ncbi:MAG: hypothetical protein MUO62_16555 [Anaerolineales bacterium]|nr:hypothetical protein [Anaerolineales bacterium]